MHTVTEKHMARVTTSSAFVIIIFYDLRSNLNTLELQLPISIFDGLLEGKETSQS